VGALATGRPAFADDPDAACMRHADQAAAAIRDAGGTKLDAMGAWREVADWWFAPEFDEGSKREYRTGRGEVDRARAICCGCPLRDACLDHALDAHEPWGLWGGLDAGQRRALRLNRRTA